ncbi:MAG: rhodanese-like domain-containing protein [Crocinitomicaceae bacterium]|nr:rhodanese-like domain-containing protein [Crocinitomicaceae bacterium]
MKQIFILFVAFVALASCSEAQVSEGGEAVVNKVVSAAEFKDMVSDDVQVIDVRTAEEYAAGFIGNATNIDYYGANFEDELKKLDMNKTTLVYCAAGGRSGKAAWLMKELGFTEVYDLQGGYGKWPY